MDTLKAEIERKKRQLEESNLLKDPKKKYFKRADLASKQAEDYWKKHSNVVKTNHNSQAAEDEERHKANGEVKTDRHSQLPRKEVIRKLRERGEPIRLFGEDDFDAYKRLKKLETSEPDIKNEGYSNDFQAAMEKVDQDYLNEIIKSTGEEDQNKSNDVSVKDDGTTLDDVVIMRKELGQGDKDKDHEIVLRFFKFVLKKWGEQLNTRPEEEKRVIKGKMASATHSQTVAYLKPLFRKLKYKDVDEGLLESIVEIVQHMMDRNYIKICNCMRLVIRQGIVLVLLYALAIETGERSFTMDQPRLKGANDSYLEMAIGNAPWPIGVTMVGIHARTGREKISSRYVAHVLNDETQRKYIQAVKRLMTQCQNLFPTDPSRSYNFLRTTNK